jgi:hypothetical protein
MSWSLFVLADRSKYKPILFLIAIFGILIFVWTIASLMKPQWQFPSEVVSRVFWHHEGERRQLDDSYGDHLNLAYRVQRELMTIAPAFAFLGGSDSPVELTIDADAPNRFQVTELSIWIGKDTVVQSGKLSLALAKAWLLRNGDTGKMSSEIRFEAAADFLSAMLQGEKKEQREQLPHPNGFTPKIRSWLQATSFKDTIVSVLWQVYREQGLSARVHFMKRWSQVIRERSAASQTAGVSNASVDSFSGWRLRLTNDITSLLPLPLTESETSALHQSLRLAELDLSQPAQVSAQVSPHLSKQVDLQSKAFLEPQVDFYFYVPAAHREHLTQISDFISLVSRRRRVTVLIETQDALFTIPGQVRLEDRSGSRNKKLGEDGMIYAKTLIWESCREPTVKEALRVGSIAKRLLFVKWCQNPMTPAYAALIADGVQGFARANPDVDFVQLVVSSLRLAMTRRLIQSGQKVLDSIAAARDELSHGSDVAPGSRWLGLSSAQWNEDARAHQVLGAIEAIEWFRLAEKR